MEFVSLEIVCEIKNMDTYDSFNSNSTTSKVPKSNKLFKPIKATKFEYKIFQKVKKLLTTYFSIFGRKMD